MYRRLGSVVLWVVVFLFAAAVLNGCAFYRALTFSSDDRTSFKREGSKATLQAYARKNPDNCIAGRPVLDKPAAVAFPAAVAAAVVTAGLNIGESELSDYLKKKQKEFTANYNATVNVDGFYSRGEPIDLATERTNNKVPPPSKYTHYSQASVNCLKLVRTTTDASGKEQPALEWVASLRPNPSGTALQLRTEALTLHQAAARTDSNKRKVDISVEVKLDVTSVNEKGEIVTTTVADKILAYPGAQTPGSGSPTPYPLGTTPPSSSWFAAIPRSQKDIERCETLQTTPPICVGVSPTTISVLVTEVGSGGDSFGDLAKQIDDNKKTINDAISGAVKDALTPKATGGSSKSN